MEEEEAVLVGLGVLAGGLPLVETEADQEEEGSSSSSMGVGGAGPPPLLPLPPDDGVWLGGRGVSEGG